jgi:hypothetical protein
LVKKLRLELMMEVEFEPVNFAASTSSAKSDPVSSTNFPARRLSRASPFTRSPRGTIDLGRPKRWTSSGMTTNHIVGGASS